MGNQSYQLRRRLMLQPSFSQLNIFLFQSWLFRVHDSFFSKDCRLKLHVSLCINFYVFFSDFVLNHACHGTFNGLFHVFLWLWIVMDVILYFICFSYVRQLIVWEVLSIVIHVHLNVVVSHLNWLLNLQLVLLFVNHFLWEFVFVRLEDALIAEHFLTLFLLINFFVCLFCVVQFYWFRVKRIWEQETRFPISRVQIYWVFFRFSHEFVFLRTLIGIFICILAFFVIF